jgi:hypothetical protein
MRLGLYPFDKVKGRSRLARAFRSGSRGET